MKRRNSGFTIVELLIVIVVIAILATITIVAFSGVAGSAKEASLRSDLRNNAQKLAESFSLQGAYPPTQTDAAIQASEGNTLSYRANSTNGYCLQATNGNLSFYITGKSGKASAGKCVNVWITRGTQTGAPCTNGCYTLVLNTENFPFPATVYQLQCIYNGMNNSSPISRSVPANGTVALTCSSEININATVSVNIIGWGSSEPFVGW